MRAGFFIKKKGFYSHGYLSMDRLKYFKDVFFPLSILLYVLGFIIVNYYYLTYGFMPEEFLSIRYFSASILFIVISFIFYLLADTINYDDENKEFKVDIHGYTFLGLAVFIIWTLVFNGKAFDTKYSHPFIIVPAIFISLIIPNVAVRKKPSQQNIRIFLASQIIFIYLLLDQTLSMFITWNFAMMVIFKKVIEPFLKDGKPKVDFNNIFSRDMLIVIFMFLAYLTAFSGYYYSIIPGYMGGGLPLSVNVLINEEKRSELESLGIKAEDNRWSGDLKLLYRGSKTFYFENQNHPILFSCIEMRADMFEGIRYTGKQAFKLTGYEYAKEMLKGNPSDSQIKDNSSTKQ